MLTVVALLGLLAGTKSICSPSELELKLPSLIAEIARPETSSKADADARALFDGVERSFTNIRDQVTDGKPRARPCVVRDSIALFGAGTYQSTVGAYDILLRARDPELLVAATVRAGQVCLLRALAIRNQIPLSGNLDKETRAIYEAELLGVAGPSEDCAVSMFRDALRAAALMRVQGDWLRRAGACLSCVDEDQGGANCLMLADRMHRPEGVLRCLGVSQ